MRIYCLRLLLISAFLSVVGLFLPGCGGSTTGTGGVSVVGKVLSSSGQPVANANVIVSNTGDSTTTNSSGDFVLKTDYAEKYDFLFATGNRTIKGSITAVPANANKVQVVFTIKDDSDEANETEVEFTETKNRPTKPTPKPTSKPTNNTSTSHTPTSGTASSLSSEFMSEGSESSSVSSGSSEDS